MSEYVIRVYSDGSASEAVAIEEFREWATNRRPLPGARDLVFDVNDLRPLDPKWESDDERFQRLERLRMQIEEQWLACRPTKCVDCVRAWSAHVINVEGRCEECAAKRPVATAATVDEVGERIRRAHRESYDLWTQSESLGASAAASRTIRDTAESIHQALSIDLRHVRLAPAPPTLTADEWGALDAVHALAEGGAFTMAAANWPVVARAIDKLRHKEQP